jgi:hypothetical protein
LSTSVDCVVTQIVVVNHRSHVQSCVKAPSSPEAALSWSVSICSFGRRDHQAHQYRDCSAQLGDPAPETMHVPG